MSSLLTDRPVTDGGEPEKGPAAGGGAPVVPPAHTGGGDDGPIEFRPGVPVAVGIAILAMMLAIFATGRALSSPTGPDAAPATGDAVVADAAAPVTVSLTEFMIGEDGQLTAPQGGELLVVNDGSADHNLEIVGTGLATADLPPGVTESLPLAGLAPGTYDVLCTIPGHDAAGMTGTLTITEADGVAAAAGGEGEMAGMGEMAGGHSGDYMTLEEANAMEAAMMASIGAFPAETEGTGGQVMAPEVLADGTLLFELTVDEIMWEVEPGKLVPAMAYNGQIPGPTIKADVGDEVVIRVHNGLDNEATTLHPHGLNAHAIAIDGVAPITQDPIRPGESFDYAFTATEPSLSMYHSHHHALHQVPDGLAGAMIIGDYAELTGQEGVTQEVTMMLNDAGTIGFSLNGKSFPATEPVVAEVGERVMVHYMNEGVMAHPMHLHGQTGWIVAKDGFPLPQPYRADTINVAPGERYTVVYDATEPGTWVWHCHVLSHVKKSDGAMFGMLTAMVVTEPETGSAAGGDLGTEVEVDETGEAQSADA